MLPTALAGIITGITLAIARVIGETAPLLIIAGSTDSTNFNLFKDQMMTLPVFIYYSYTQPGNHPEIARPMAWGAALVLILIVLVLNLLARVLGKIFAPKTGTDPLPRAERNTMAKSIDISDLDIYYGDFLAVEGVSMTIPARSVTALIGPSGCGKSTFLRSLNRMHEVIPGARVEGKVDGRRPVALRPGRRPGGGTPDDRHGLPAPEPVPDDVDLRERPRRPAAEQLEAQEVRRRRRRREVADAAPTSGTRSRTA